MSDGLLDERVVEMRFDNADFERNVNQSIKTIDKLKESLDFENAGESFENISAAAAKCDMKPLEDSLEGITVKFNMLEMVAANVLGNITNKIVDAGAKLAKSLTVDQFTSGWAKYDQKTAAVQTIISATGASIDVVNQKLEKLIWFADETSYDFVDMVNNIGKFTSAGVDLDDAVDSMMGISNWAAASGAGIQQASRAMYNLSQAIGMGYVGLTDWRSIELANMATKEFKETVIETALEMGTLQQTADGTVKTLNGKFEVTAENMRNSLKEQWFSTDVLNSALKKYNEFANEVREFQDEWAELHNGEYITVSRAIKEMESMGYAMDTLGAKAFMRAQEATKFTEAVAATADAVSSGWMRTFELIFGNYEQAKKLWTDLANDMYDVFASGGERRNDMLADVMHSNYQKMLDEMPDSTEMNNRLYNKLLEMTKNNKGVEYAEALFNSYDSLEDLLQYNADNIYDSSLEDAFKQVAADFDREADAALKLSKQLKAGSVSLKQTVIRLAGGQFGNEIETQKKEVEKLGYNYEMLSELAEEYKAGFEIPWDQYQSDFIEYLDEQYSSYKTFVKKITELLPEEGFFGSLTEFSGRDKLIGGFQNLIDTFKNLYLTIVEIGNGISDLIGSGSFLEKLINGFSFFTNVLNYSDKEFERVQEGIYGFFHGGLQSKWNRFWHGYDVKDVLENNKAAFSGFWGDIEKAHVPGMLDHIFSIYKDHLAVLPANVSQTIEKVRVELSTFFGSIPQKINEIKEKIFGKFEIHEVQSLFSNNVDTVITHTGGLLNDLKDKIRSLGNGLGGKIFDGLLNTIKKVADFMFGYRKEDGTPIEGAFVRIYDKATALWQKLKDIGKVISNVFNKLSDFFLGKKIHKGTAWSDELNKYVPLYERVGGVIDSVKEKIENIKLGLGFNGKENGLNIVLGIFNGIIEGIKNIGDWIKKHIFDPFVEGFKRVFGIHSPAKEMEPLGENIFLGILAGILNVAKSIGSWIKSHILIPIKNELSKAFNNFLENTSFGQSIQKIINKFESLKHTIERLAASKPFQEIKRFIFGEKDAEGKVLKNNIFGKIGTAIKLVTDSAAFKSINEFIFGKKAEDGTVIKNNIFGKIGTAINLLTSTSAYKSIHDFIFGKKAEDGTVIKNNIFGKIGTVIKALTETPAYKSVHDFIFGKKDTEGNVIKNNIFGKFTTAINLVRKNIGDLPKRIQKAKNGLEEFFLGQKKYTGSSWNNETGQWENHYIREGNLIDRLKDKFKAFKTVFDKVKRFFFGNDGVDKNVFSDLAEDLSNTDGLIGRIKNSITNIFKGSDKKQDKSLVDYLLEFLGLKQANWRVDLRNIVITLAGINLFFSSFKLGRGQFTLFEYKNGLEVLTETLSEIIDGFKTLAVSVAILVGTWMALSAYLHYVKLSNWDMIGAGVIIAAIAGFLVLMGNVANNASKNINPFTAMAIGVMANMILQMGILAAAVGWFLKKTGTTSEFITVSAVLAGLILMIGIAGRLMMKQGKDIKTAAGSFIGFAAILHEFTNFLTTIAISLGVIFALYKKGIIDSENLNKAFITLLQIMLLAAGFLLAIAGAQAIIQKTTSMNFTGFLSMVAMLISAKTMIVLVMGAIAAIYKVLERNKTRDAEGNAHFDTSTIWKSLQFMAIILGGIVAFINLMAASMSNLSNTKSIDITKFLFLIAVFRFVRGIVHVLEGAALTTKMVGSDVMRDTVLYLAGLITAVVVLIKVIDKIKHFDFQTFGAIITGFVALGGLTAAVGYMASVMTKYNINDWKTLVPMFIAIGEVLAGMVILSLAISLLGAIGKIPTFTEGIGVAILMLGGLALLAKAVTNLKSAQDKYKIDGATTILPMLITIGEMVIAMLLLSKAITILGGIGSAMVPLLGPAVIAIVAVTAGVILLGAAFMAMQKGLQWVEKTIGGEDGTTLKESIDGVVEMFVTLAEGLGRIVGAFAGGVFGETLMTTLSVVVTGLTEVATQLKDDFLPAIRSFTADDVAKAGILSGIMLGVFTAEAFESLAVLASKFNEDGDIDKVIKGLVHTASEVKEKFLPAVQDFTGEHVEKAAFLSTILFAAFTSEVFEDLAILADKLKTDGDVDKVITGLVTTATMLKEKFLPVVDDLSEEHVKKAGYLSSIMLAVFSSTFLEEAASLVEKLKKDGELDKVITGLIETAGKIKNDFMPAIKDLGEDDVTQAGYLSSIMLKVLQSTLFEKLSEFVGIFDTGGDLETIITGLSNTVTQLNPFLTSVRTLSEDDVTKAGYLPKVLGAIVGSQALAGLEKIVSFFVGDTNFVELFEKLNEDGGIVDGIVKFSQKVAGQNLVDAVTATEVMKTIFAILTTDTGKIKNFSDFVTSDKNSSKIPDGIAFLSDEVVPKISALQKSFISNGIDSSIITEGLKSISGIFDILGHSTNNLGELGKVFETDKNGEFKKQGDLDKIGQSFAFISDFIIPKLASIQSALGSNNFTDVGKLAGVIKSIFDIFAVDEYSVSSFGGFDAETLGSAFTVLDTVVIQAIKDLQQALLDSAVDSDYIDKTIGSFSQLITAITDFKNIGLSEDEVSEIGSYIIRGLVNALDEGAWQVHEAAKRVAGEITKGLKLTLEIHSPSKVAYEIGAFVAEGLTNGLRAGEGMTYSMAQRFGEGTAKALEEGLGDFDSVSQHAINMVTMDLLDENRFDMKSFVSGFNRFGNEELDFEAMRKFLTNNFGEVFDQNMIDGFVNSYEQTMNKLNDTINDKDYAELIMGIGAGDFGLSENTIIDALTKELGTYEKATQAIQDYYDVKEGTLKINQDLLKQQKQNPPMTLEQYMDMIAHEEEGYQRALKGEFDELARLNGTTRAQEMEKAGFNAKLLQGRLNEGGLSQEQIEAYIKDKALKDYEAEQTRLVDNIIRNNEAVTESATEVAEALNFDIDDPLGEKLAIKDAAALKEVAGAAEEVAEAQQSVAETAEAKAEAVEAETAAVEASNNANKEAAKVNRDGAVFKSLDKVELGQALEAFREGKKLTEEQTRIIENARQATISEGAFGIAVGEEGWADQMKKWGLTETNAKYLAHFANFYDPTTQSLEEYVKWVEKSDEVTEDLTKSTENAGESAKKTGTSLANIADDGKAVVDIFKHAFSTDAYNEKTGSFSIDFEKAYQDSIADAEKAGDETRKKYLEAFYSGLGEEGFNKVGDNGKIELKAEDVFKLVGTEGGIKGFAAAKGGELLGNLIGENIPFLGDIFGNTKEFDFTQIFSGTDSTMSFFKGLVASVTGLNKELDETSDKKVDIDVNDSKVESAISMVDELNKKYTLDNNEKNLAAQGIKDLQNGVKVTEKSADAIQKLWDGAMIGMYKSGEERITAIKQLLNLDNFDWETLSSLLDENGNFDITKQTSSALDQANKVIQMATNGETYSTADLMNDIYAGKWGYDTDRLKALEKAGYDAQKVQENFLKWYNGDKSVENLGDDYLKVSESEKAAAEQAEKMNAILNQTPEGAFRSVADFLDGVNKAVENSETADKFKQLMTDIADSMKSLSLSDASNFEKVAGFLTAVRTSAKESSTIAQDFKAFVDGIKDSIIKLGDIDIKNPEGMEKVKDFLNNIKIENKDTLEAVSSFIGNIVEFATGANAGGDYSTKLTESIDALMTSINNIDLNKEATTPVIRFLHELTNSAGILEKSDSGVVQTFISNIYTALENSKDKAAQAADVIAQVIVDTLAGYYDQLNIIGHNYVWWLARGILKAKSLAQSAAESIAGALMDSLKDYAVSKSQKSGSDFVSNFVTGMNSPESQKLLQRSIDNLFNPKTEAKDLPSGADALAEKLAMKNGKETPESEQTEPQKETGPSAGTKFGQQFVQDMSAAIEQGAGTVGETLTTLGATLSTTVSIDTEGISDKASEYFKNLASGLLAGYKANSKDLNEVSGKVRRVFTRMVPDGYSMGYNFMINLRKGMQDGAAAASFGGVGNYVAQGTADGIVEGTKSVVEAANNLTEKTNEVAEKGWAIASPSKIFYGFGRYLDEGLANGIRDYTNLPVKQSDGMAEVVTGVFSDAISTIADDLDTNMNLDPVIRPVIDMSDVYDSANTIDAMLSSEKAIDISAAENAKSIQSTDNMSEVTPGTQVFNQYNYSPKALSRLDIYRQTKNQFAMIKGVNQLV